MASTAKIHFAYIVTILIAIIIALMTVQWGGIHDLVVYFGFALTLSSLVLALLAIVYSYFSNASFGQNISTLNAASQQMSQSAVELTAATEALRKRVDEIPGALEAMGVRMEETRGAVVTLTERTAAWTTPPAPEGGTPSGSLAERFLDASPLAALIVLYAASRGAALGRRVDLQKMQPKMGLSSFDYMFAFLLAADMAGVVEKQDYGPEGFLIKHVDPIIRAGVRDRITKVAQGFDERMKDRPKGAMTLSQRMRDAVAVVDSVIEGGNDDEKAPDASPTPDAPKV
jgi:hypothetical protein